MRFLSGNWDPDKKLHLYAKRCTWEKWGMDIRYWSIIQIFIFIKETGIMNLNYKAELYDVS